MKILQSSHGNALRQACRPRPRKTSLRRLYSSSVSASEYTEDDRKRIHFAGRGRTTIFMGTFLRLLPVPPPVTLHMSPSSVDVFREHGSRLQVTIYDRSRLSLAALGTQIATGFDREPHPDFLRKEDTLKAKEYKVSDRPILNLVCTVRCTAIAQCIRTYKDRLRPESTIFCTEDAYDSLNVVFKEIFPDRRTRPTFRICIQRCSLAYESPDYPAFTRSPARPSDAGPPDSWHVNARCNTGIAIGPVAIDPKVESKSDLLRREGHSRYLLDQLKACEHLGVYEPDSEAFFYRRYQRTLLFAVLGTLSIHYECEIADLHDNPEAKTMMNELIIEAWTIVQKEVQRVTLQDIFNWFELRGVDEEAFVSGGLIGGGPKFYKSMGRDTGVEQASGWLINRAKQFGLRLHAHELMLEMVIKKTQEAKELLAKQEGEAKVKTTKAVEQQNGLKIRYLNQDFDRPDKVEVIRERKLRNQRAKFGTRSLSDEYLKPQSKVVGNQKLRFVKAAK